MTARSANSGRQTFHCISVTYARRKIVGVGRIVVARRKKGWACPNCTEAVSAGMLLDWTMGGALGDVGRWYVRGRCPSCQRWVQFTKHGALVLRRPGKPGYPATVGVKHVKGDYS